jgi:hypothetical protein
MSEERKGKRWKRKKSTGYLPGLHIRTPPPSDQPPQPWVRVVKGQPAFIMDFFAFNEDIVLQFPIRRTDRAQKTLNCSESTILERDRRKN